ncbi:unnamed protein product [Arabidopsis lyrata]|nr:unnamed protein product [Arabidopsis lyrata]
MCDGTSGGIRAWSSNQFIDLLLLFVVLVQKLRYLWSLFSRFSSSHPAAPWFFDQTLVARPFYSRLFLDVCLFFGFGFVVVGRFWWFNI